MRWPAALAAGALLIGTMSLGMTAAVRAQTPFPDVGPGHWTYEAVRDLASAGLVLGYPDGRFLGNRTLTRYEMATIIKRVVDNVAQRMGTVPPAPGTTPPPAVTPGQLAEVRRLVEEYKTELTVIGTDLAAVRAQLQSAQENVQRLKDITTAQRTELDTLNQARAQTRVDGYIQGRYITRATTDGLRAPEGNPQTGSGGTDTSRGLGGNTSTFNVRRARINIRGDVSDNAAYRVQLDAGSSSGSSSAVSIKEAYVTVKNIGIASVPGLSTLFGGGIGDGKFFTTQDTTLGQQVTPFSYLLQYSSSDRWAPERYIGFSDNGAGLFPDQDYDKGVTLNGLILNKFQYQLGLFNGNGTASNDFGRRKDFVGRIGVPLAGNWDVGISGYDGEGNNVGTTVLSSTPPGGTIVGAPTGPFVPATRRRVRSLVGVDTQYYFPFGVTLKAEYVRGKGGLNGNAANTVPTALKPYVDGATVEAYYAELGYNVNPKLLLVGAYEYFNRNADPADSGPLSTFNGRRVAKSNFAEERLHVGALYYLDAATRFRLWYEAPLNYPNPPGGSEGGSGSSVRGRTGQYTAEIQVRF